MEKRPYSVRVLKARQKGSLRLVIQREWWRDNLCGVSKINVFEAYRYGERLVRVERRTLEEALQEMWAFRRSLQAVYRPAHEEIPDEEYEDMLRSRLAREQRKIEEQRGR